MSSFLLWRNMKLVDVCINLPAKQISKTFTYHLPEEFSTADVGWRVEVPFSENKLEGFVIKKYDGEYQGDNLKAVLALIDSTSWFDENMLKLAGWIAKYYLCAFAEAMRLFLPGKKSLVKSNFYAISDNALIDGYEGYAKNLLELLSNGKMLKKEQIKAKIGFDESIVQELLANGMIFLSKENKNQFQKQISTYAKLSCDVDGYLNENPKCSSARKKALLLLQENGGELPVSYLKKQGVLKDTLSRMQKRDIILFEEKHVVRNSYNSDVQIINKPVLNEDQQEVYEKINVCIEDKTFETFLLYGITGSGKTEIYLEASESVYEKGGQVLVMVPEIALTGQTIKRFKERFGSDVLVFHSKLSLNERMDVFEYIKTGHPCILIGVRSAVFAPFAKLGLVIIDEEHEYSYKQEERPGYHARDVALKLAELNNAVLILGSATPSMESFYKAKKGQYTFLKLSRRYQDVQLPNIIAVDMKAELQNKNYGVFSDKLKQYLTETFEKGEQAIILLNRRGYSTFVMCRDCGYVEKCEHCAVALVYHSTDSVLRCHYCGYTRKARDVCPSCKSRRIKFFGSGTQKAEQQLSENFSGIRIARMDQDTTGRKMSHDKILSAFKNRQYDLLLGTQMVAKGHDIHNVTLVGVLSADALLNLPDFRAGERSFALLTQAAGRAGRGGKEGFAILQVYETDHPVIKFVLDHDYEGFAEYELSERKGLFYPPYSSIIKITVLSQDATDSFNKARQIIDKISAEITDGSFHQINGPFQGTVSKVRDLYKTIILIKSSDSSFIKELLSKHKLTEERHVLIDIDPLNVI